MPTEAAISAGLGATAITLTGSILGMQYDALTIGLLGGLSALMHLPPIESHLSKFWSVAASAIMGALLSPLATVAAVNMMPWLNGLGNAPVRLASAFMIGLIAQAGVPILFGVIKRKGETV